MADLRSKLRLLDQLDAPDLWERSRSMDPAGPDPEPREDGSNRRLTAGIVAIAVFIAAGAFAWQAFRPQTPNGTAAAASTSDGSILWPERTGAELEAVQSKADAGDPTVAWRLDPKEVATRFAEEVLGWGSPEGRYVVENMLNDSPPGPGIAQLSLARYAIPCPSPAPGANLIDCPPPFEGEQITLVQKASGGERGVWSVTEVRATDIALDVSPGDSLPDGTRIEGNLHVPSFDPPVVANAGVVIGTDGDCFMGSSQPEEGDFTLTVGLPRGGPNGPCPSQPAYAWAATLPSGQLDGLTDPAPISPSRDASLRLYGLTAIPITVEAQASSPSTATDTSSKPTPTRSPDSSASTGTLSTSTVLPGGELRCTATFAGDTVTPGEPIGVRFEETNISSQPATVPIGDNGAAGWLLISSAGQQVSDTSLDHSGVGGPPPTQKSVAPGDSVSIEAMDTPVLWPGPLDVTPVCEGQQMPPVRLDTASTQAPGSPTEAVDKAVADTGGFFTNCRPKADGSWSQGSVPVGGGSTLDTRCGAWVQENPGFDVVVLAAVAPPNAPELDLSTLPAAIQAVPMGVIPQGMGVRWWIYVVTDTEAQHAGGHTVVVCANSMSYGTGLSNCGH